mgnify:CR=1 FL=1
MRDTDAPREVHLLERQPDRLAEPVLDRAADMAPGCVHCIVTSPPYWGLRAYDGEQAQDWPAGEFSPMPGAAPVRVDQS